MLHAFQENRSLWPDIYCYQYIKLENINRLVIYVVIIVCGSVKDDNSTEHVILILGISSVVLVAFCRIP